MSTWLRGAHIYIVSKSFFSYPMWDIIITSHVAHDILIVSHKIVGTNRQTLLARSNKLSHWGRESILIPFVMTHSLPCRYCLLWAQWAFMALKCVYMIKKSPYINSVKNIFPYPMWDIYMGGSESLYKNSPIFLCYPYFSLSKPFFHFIKLSEKANSLPLKSLNTFILCP